MDAHGSGRFADVRQSVARQRIAEEGLHAVPARISEHERQPRADFARVCALASLAETKVGC